jgi:hypothetical protein
MVCVRHETWRAKSLKSSKPWRMSTLPGGVRLGDGAMRPKMGGDFISDKRMFE